MPDTAQADPQVEKTRADPRDVWWCWIVNEPGVIHFQGAYPKCSECGWVDDSPPDRPDPPEGCRGAETSEGFRNLHTFCCHVNKPRVAHA